MTSTDYRDTLITPAPDCPARRAEVPPDPGSVAGLQHGLLTARPYGLTSDDLLFEVHALRNGIAPDRHAQEREAFFGTPKACLRASPLVKRYGWALHHDAAGRVALVERDTDAYCRLAENGDVFLVAGMRNRRA